MLRRAGFKAFIGLKLSLVFWLFAAGQPLAAVDFIRGDANSDGTVSISDSHFLNSYLFLGTGRPECFASGDSDDSGVLDLTDSIFLLNFLFLGGAPLPPPFPAIGPDPTADAERFPCASYGSGSPLEDPAARMEVLSATASGGSDRLAVITLGVSSSKAIAGYHAALLDGRGVIEGGESISQTLGLKDLTGLITRSGFLAGQAKDGRIEIGALASLVPRRPVEIPPGENVPVVEVLVCLKPGTPAGEYPVTLEAGEFVASCLMARPQAPCSDTGRAIRPTLVSGTLVVKADVEGQGTCDNSVPEPPPPIHILFKLEDASGAPGSTVTVPFLVKADRASTGFSYSIGFDEAILQAAGTRKLWQKPDGTPYEFEKFELNNQTGHLVGAAVISLTDTGEVLPPDQEVKVLQFDLQVSSSASPGSTELVFRDGGSASGGPVKNKLIAGGTDITPALASSFVFVNARVNIVPDVTIFIRGDSNRDGIMDITDPLATLAYLYQGASAPACLDAADANDDGQLDISDPVMTLQVLFLTRGSLPPPGPRAGKDPTADSLNCLRESP